jgi:3-hydroxyisobutyrate dehydrogenase-like beta-hydroxyacid dehydrogenase
MSDGMEQRPAGLIGLGLLGKAIAGRLLSAGFKVAGFDVAESAREEARAMGVEVVDDHHAVAAVCDVIFLSLPTSEIRRELLWGAGRLADSLNEGALLLDTTTGRPEDTEADWARLNAMQVDFVDVCVLASSALVSRGEAVLLVGDAESRAGGYAPILQTFGRQIFYLGKAGDGSRMKLVANQVLGLNRLVLAEALGLAERCGLDLEKTLDVLKSGPASSQVMFTKGTRMIAGDFTPEARLAQHAKDVGLILEMGEHCGANLPLSALHREVLTQLIDSGLGGEDNSAVVRAFK